ncbi:hypothetical protein NL676_033870 [Syzygium grande]|nr:hypothetical protein NL676_033870 [Syzygium grande]
MMTAIYRHSQLSTQVMMTYAPAQRKAHCGRFSRIIYDGEYRAYPRQFSTAAIGGRGSWVVVVEAGGRGPTRATTTVTGELGLEEKGSRRRRTHGKKVMGTVAVGRTLGQCGEGRSSARVRGPASQIARQGDVVATHDSGGERRASLGGELS